MLRGNALDCMETGNWEDHKRVALIAEMFIFDERYSDSDARRNPANVTIIFDGIAEIELEGFNHQNAICGLSIRRQFSERLKRNLFRVDWGGAAIKHDVSLICETVTIESVEKLTGT